MWRIGIAIVIATGERAGEGGGVREVGGHPSPGAPHPCSPPQSHAAFTDASALSNPPTQVVAEMTNEERSLLLRFATGRSRLPATLELHAMHGATNDALPEARTCFFALHLPSYSSKAILQEKLHYAIHNCMAIDLDTDVSAAAWDE